MIHVMAAVGLSRATVPAPIVGNHTEALAEEEKASAYPNRPLREASRG